MCNIITRAQALALLMLLHWIHPTSTSGIMVALVRDAQALIVVAAAVADDAAVDAVDAVDLAANVVWLLRWLGMKTRV